VRSLLWLSLAACSSASSAAVAPTTPDAGETAPVVELVCASNFCGVIEDTVTHAHADCGPCAVGAECGDNGVAHVCGDECLPYANVNACTYAFGYGWGAGFGAQTEYRGGCNYVDQDNCVPLWNDWPADGVCSGEICGGWWCCVGSPTLIPGAVAAPDASLP